MVKKCKFYYIEGWKEAQPPGIWQKGPGIWQLLKFCPGVVRGMAMLGIDWYIRLASEICNGFGDEK